MITLTAGGTTLTLNPQLNWADERSHTDVVQSVAWSLTGRPIIEVAQRHTGRPITLQGSETRAWVPRTVVDQLQAWRDTPGLQLALSLRGRTFTVAFRHQDDPALEAAPIFEVFDPAEDDPFVITLKLMVI